VKQRFVIVTIDTLSELLKAYVTEEDLPATAQPLKMYMKPDEPGRFAIEFEDLDWKEGLPPLAVNFHIKRMHGVS